jgi:hypothetical protein
MSKQSNATPSQTTRQPEPESITAMLARGDVAGAVAKFNRFRDELSADVKAHENKAANHGKV